MKRGKEMININLIITESQLFQLWKPAFPKEASSLPLQSAQSSGRKIWHAANQTKKTREQYQRAETKTHQETSHS